MLANIVPLIFAGICQISKEQCLLQAVSGQVQEKERYGVCVSRLIEIEFGFLVFFLMVFTLTKLQRGKQIIGLEFA